MCKTVNYVQLPIAHSETIHVTKQKNPVFSLETIESTFLSLVGVSESSGSEYILPSAARMAKKVLFS